MSCGLARVAAAIAHISCAKMMGKLLAAKTGVHAGTHGGAGSLPRHAGGVGVGAVEEEMMLPMIATPSVSSYWRVVSIGRRSNVCLAGGANPLSSLVAGRQHAPSRVRDPWAPGKKNPISQKLGMRLRGDHRMTSGRRPDESPLTSVSFRPERRD